MLRCGVLLPFLIRRRKKKVLFYNRSFFWNQSYKIHSIPQFFTVSFADEFGNHLRSRIICGPFWGSLILRSRDHLRLGIICGAVQHHRFSNVVDRFFLQRVPLIILERISFRTDCSFRVKI